MPGRKPRVPRTSLMLAVISAGLLVVGWRRAVPWPSTVRFRSKRARLVDTQGRREAQRRPDQLSTRLAPITWLLRLRGCENTGHRRPGPTRRPVLAGCLARASDVAVALSIMTGLYPTYHGVRLNGTTALSQQHTTLAEALSDHGLPDGRVRWRLRSRRPLGPQSGLPHLRRSVRYEKFKHLDLAAVQRPANEVMDAALRLAGRHARPGRSSPGFISTTRTLRMSRRSRWSSEFSQSRPGRALRREIAFVDQQVDRRRVVAAEHGPRPAHHHRHRRRSWRGAGKPWRGDARLLHLRLCHARAVHRRDAVRRLRGVRVDAQVSLVDVFPTVLALAGIESNATSPWAFAPAADVPVRRAPRETVYAYSESMAPDLQFGWSALHSLRSPRYKFIQAPRPELYDLPPIRRSARTSSPQQRDAGWRDGAGSSIG